ncbi:septum formation family protein [Streptomyces bauhiniae]|uniref:septum formation family protein n=1 Tax=Streptomyces bauhiniae TaxID=2340725 RepID=UPI0031B9F3D8
MLSGVGLGVAVLVLTTGVTGWMWQGVKDGVRESANLSPAKVDCFDSDDGELKDAIFGVRTVLCEGAHQGEVFGTFTLRDGPYPGEKAVRDAAEHCVDQRQFYAMDDWAVPRDVDALHLAPSRESWAFGDRTVTCVFSSVTEHGTLTGSLRADQTTLDAHQVAFLDAARLLNDAMDSAPDAAYAEDDLPGHKAWARRVSTALADGGHALRAHPWPATARAPLAELTARMDKARALWDRAPRHRRRRVLRAVRRRAHPDRAAYHRPRPQGPEAGDHPARPRRLRRRRRRGGRRHGRRRRQGVITAQRGSHGRRNSPPAAESRWTQVCPAPRHHIE